MFIGEIMIRAACSRRENTDSYVRNCKLANVSATKVTMERNAPDFVATLKYYTTEEGG